MPAAIPALVVSGFGAYVAGLTFIEFVGLVAVTAFANKLSADMASDSQLLDASARGSRINVTNNVEPIPVIYGMVDHASGAVAWRVTHSRCPTNGPRNTEMLTTVIVWGEGEIASLDWYYINDIENNDERFVITSDVFGGCIHAQDTRRIWVTHYTGTDDQLADPSAVAIAADNVDLNDKWTADHRLRGIAYSRFTMRFEDGLYGPNAIPTITARISGKKCYDWRTDTTGLTYNPAVILYDYLTNTRYGCGFTAAELDLASFSEAANYCEQYVIPLGQDGARRRYDCNGLLSPEDGRLDNVRKILATCRGFLVYSGGRYRLKIDKPEAAVFDLNDTILTGAWSISLDSYGRRFNRVSARFINPAREWQPDIAVVDSEAYRTTDRGEILEQELELAMVTSRAQALDIAGMELRQSRYSVVVEVNATLAGIRCEVGDVVTLTHEIPGWVAKKFRVQRIDLQNTDEVRITLTEYSDDVYDITSANEDEVPPGTTLPDPRDIEPPTDLVLGQGGSDLGGGGRMFNINVIWTPSIAPGVIGYDIEWGPSSSIVEVGGATWSRFQVGGGQTFTAIIPPVPPGVEYSVRVRARNSLGMTSDWVTGVVSILQMAYVSPPAGVTATQSAAGVGRISWTPPDDWRATYVEVWTSTSSDFHDSGTFPVLSQTVLMSTRYLDVSHAGTTRYYWLRSSNGIGATARKSEGWTPSEWGEGLVITG